MSRRRTGSAPLYHSQGISTKSSGKFRADPRPGCKFVAQFAPTPPPTCCGPPAQILFTAERIRAEASVQRIVTMAVSSNSTPQWRADDRRQSRQNDRQRPTLGRSRQRPHHLESGRRQRPDRRWNARRNPRPRSICVTTKGNGRDDTRGNNPSPRTAAAGPSPFRGLVRPVRLAAYSCGGSRGIVQAHALRSLLIPCGNHRDHPGEAGW